MTTLKLTSTAFAHGGEIPSKYTGEGQDMSPPAPRRVNVIGTYQKHK